MIFLYKTLCLQARRLRKAMGIVRGKRSNLIVRVLIYLLGVGMLALGVVLNIKTDYGVSPVNSLPYTISQISGMELGNTTMLCYLLYILIQFLIMKRNHNYNKNLLLQLPFGILFGKFTTLFNHYLSFQLSQHHQRLAVMLLAVFFTALGIFITISMHIVPIPPDGLTNEIAKLMNKDLGMAKILFDIASVLMALIISFIFVGKIIGIGYGTLFCAFFIGRTVTIFKKVILIKPKN